jgi:hypothetical protein
LNGLSGFAIGLVARRLKKMLLPGFGFDGRSGKLRKGYVHDTLFCGSVLSLAAGAGDRVSTDGEDSNVNGIGALRPD